MTKENHYCYEERSKSIKEAKADGAQKAKKESKFEAEVDVASKFFNSIWGLIIFTILGTFVRFWWWPYIVQVMQEFLKN
ncbi:hypothetical protein FOF72_05260 [Lactobacillus jensenii]|jgi:hypothetical protein|uniref:Uncharacterized protein n=1 Tax=Lactobacillus jensenii TaxID=109790 RepID=A0A558L5Z9_LACJE|nr:MULTISPECIES: hypothetical protein [Lactobacillus]ERJ42943.1 hypothetical protein N581_09965 [Lactobacillus jensenii MD IIE-70(2)]MCZ3543291.1 hypothetical protein [Lactobacillus gasseri]EEX28224.1 hypothetical protein HMPREF0527_00459 [Lactobacillus jensenii SJ-7A-US]KAA9233655.1 hypothetical protein F6I36_08025 [Lactobacillus jensenii]KAA9258439.1 hypothetical protein F6I24_05155 [Lactobacillus jensenii]